MTQRSDRRKDARGKRVTDVAAQYTMGEKFRVTWRFSNMGETSWGAGYSLFQTGSVYGFNRDAVPHPLGAARRLAWDEITDVETVAPGESAEFTVDMVAPMESGGFVRHWQLRDAEQNDVGYPVYVRIAVPEKVEIKPEAYTAPEWGETRGGLLPPYPALTNPPQLGFNINPDDPKGYANPELLKGVGAVRIVFKLYERERRFSRQQWPTTKDYQKLVSDYMRAGINVLFVINQETVVPKGGWTQWRSLDRWTDQQWDDYVDHFARIASQIAGSFRWVNERRPGTVAFQIWNEGDESMTNALKKVRDRNLSLEDAYTLPMDEKQYAKLLPKTAAAIKRQDPRATVVAMGLVSGREPAAQYLWGVYKANKNFLDNVDALAVHPYDCHPRNFKGVFPFANFGHSWPFHLALSDVAAFARHVKGDSFPIWVTEIGPKPRKATDTKTLAEYMRATVYDFAKLQRNIGAVFWFPWADFHGTMEVSNVGMVDAQGQPKADLWDAYEDLRDWLAGKLHEEDDDGEQPPVVRPPVVRPPVVRPPVARPPVARPPVARSTTQQFDIWQYIVGKPGFAHGIRSIDAAGNEHNETVTTVDRNGKKLFVKNGVYETLWLEDWNGKPYIWRGLDTSPGNGRMYTVWFNGREGSPWCPRYMKIGDKWEAPHEHWVQFYMLDSGQMSSANSGRWRNRIMLYAHYPEMKFVNGVVIKDVIKLGWDGGEKYYYGRDRGLVGWAREHHDPHTPQQSGVSEVHQPHTRSRDLGPIHHASYQKPPQA